jgi:hypothetical protein
LDGWAAQRILSLHDLFGPTVRDVILLIDTILGKRFVERNVQVEHLT